MKPKKTRAVNRPHIGEERLRPDGSLIRCVREEGEDGYPVDHYCTVDTLALMLKHGSITSAMHDAGQQFTQDFARAFASGVASPRLDGLPAGTAHVERLVERNAGAARAVRQALDAAGGIGSPAGSVLWFVVGAGMSVREWARRCGWAGKAISSHEAKGILIAGLGMLARYYGYDRSGSTTSKKTP